MKLSRRNFFGLTAAAGAAAAVPFLTEPQLARAQHLRLPRHMPPGAVRIDSNENPLGPCDEACTAMAGLLHEGGRYDDELTDTLVETFCDQTGFRPENIMLGAGSTEPLVYTVLAYTSKDRSYVTADPGYEAGMYAAKANGARVIKVPLTSNYAHDVRAMVAADPNAGVFYICNPNNPTGTITSREDIEYALNHKPQGSILLVDEAYIHFSDATPSFDLVKAGKDIIILRTFSKVYGMAGLRCGLAVARPDLLTKIRPYGRNFMPILAVAAATASLKNPDLVAKRRKINTDIRSETFDWLAASHYKFIPSQTNCFMVDAGRPGKQVVEAMAQRNVFIGRTWPVWPNYVRITVGSRDDMQKFQDAWKAVMDMPESAFARLPQSTRRGFGELPGSILT